MSWSTELFCNVSYNRETFNSRGEVEDRISELNENINACERIIRDMALMTEPSKFMDKDSNDNPYYFVTNLVEDNFKLLREYIVERWKLSLLLENWDNCHNEEGLAIYPPDEIDWNTAYLCGDFVHSTKYPTKEDIMG